MKRSVKVICMLTAAAVLLHGCAAIEKITTLKGLDGKVLAMLANPVSAEDARKTVDEKLGITLKDFIYFDTNGGAVSALLSQQVDAVYTTSFTGNYYAERNEKLKAIQIKNANNAESFAHMALRAEDTELLQKINAAILDMKADGTLDKLENDYITVSAGEPEGKDLPILPDAPTVRIGISGDIPPLDYIAANGKPGGYCAELLTEISKRANINFEFLSIANEVKFTALSSKKIDVFLFHFINNGLQVSNDSIEANDSIAFSEPYYSTSDSVFLVLK